MIFFFDFFFLHYSYALKQISSHVAQKRCICTYKYHNKPKYWNRQAQANSVDPDQMLHNAASDQGLHCLLLIQQYFNHISR